MNKYPSTSNIAASENFGDIEYQPWGMLFYRDHVLTSLADELSLLINCGEHENLRPYFAVLRQILVNVQPLFKPNNIMKWFNEINAYEVLLEDWEMEQKQGVDTSPMDLIKKLRWFHRKLLFAKQYVGFGVPRKSRQSTKDEIKRALMGE